MDRVLPGPAHPGDMLPNRVRGRDRAVPRDSGAGRALAAPPNDEAPAALRSLLPAYRSADNGTGARGPQEPNSGGEPEMNHGRLIREGIDSPIESSAYAVQPFSW